MKSTSMVARVAKQIGEARPALIELLLNIPDRPDLIRLGSEYGGKLIPDGLINSNSICYCAGVGEDASFDLTLIQRYGCTVHAFDPTPRSITYAAAVSEKEPSFKFFPYGVWDKDAVLRFYSPKNPTHVSHSIKNLQKTEDFFEAPCKSLSTIMKELGHNRIDLLKLDVEGAEHDILKSIRVQGIPVRIICVEFDSPTSLRAVMGSIRQLRKAGMTAIARYRWDFTLLATDED